mmetsp:Transcript_17955/g.15868  ORF Transcript_17955/g.15868 Transcript_17955/m.15868 type:complete len:261 (+) Transcript_17955:214-996(+)
MPRAEGISKKTEEKKKPKVSGILKKKKKMLREDPRKGQYILTEENKLLLDQITKNYQSSFKEGDNSEILPTVKKFKYKKSNDLVSINSSSRSINTSRSHFSVFSSSQQHLCDSQMISHDKFLSFLDKRFHKLKNYANRLQSPKQKPSKVDQMRELIKKSKRKNRNNYSTTSEKSRKSQKSNRTPFQKDLRTISPNISNSRSRLDLLKGDYNTEPMQKEVLKSHRSVQNLHSIAKEEKTYIKNENKYKLLIDPFVRMPMYK